MRYPDKGGPMFKKYYPSPLITQTTEEVDMKKHKDFIFGEYSIDVKGPKYTRYDKDDVPLTVLEYINTIGKNGWMRSRVTHIAFWSKEGWYFANRQELYDFFTPLIDLSRRVQKSIPRNKKGDKDRPVEPYVFYQRSNMVYRDGKYDNNGDKDEFIYVPTKDVIRLSYFDNTGDINNVIFK